MRVIFLKSQIHARGGLEKYTFRLAEAFAQRGCEVVLLTSGWDRNLSTPPGVRCINVATPKPLSLLHILEFNHSCQRYLAKHSADVVFGMDRNDFQTHYRAGNGVHAAYLNYRRNTECWFKGVSFNLNPLHRKIQQLEKTAFEDPKLQRLFTNSALVKQQILDHYATPSEKICVVHNGVEWYEMQNAYDHWPAAQPELKRALNRTKSSYQLLFAGHNFDRKGLAFLLAGLKMLGRSDVQLSVVGKDRNQKKWIEKVAQMGLTGQVVFWGPQPSLKPFYQMADALVVPSVYDPFANVALEALAMGLFIVSSLSNGAHEILTPETGVKIGDLTDPSSITKALSHALAYRKTPDLADKIRSSVKDLDFSVQLQKIVSATLQAPCSGTS